MKNPELRFKNDIDDWETFELGNIGSTYNGLNGKSKTDFGHGEAKYITYMNVYKNTISNPKIVDNIEIDNTQNKVVYGDILFTTSSETPEEVGMSSVWVSNEDNIYLNSFCFGYRPTKELNPIFMGYLLRANSFREQMMLLAQGISRYNISKTKAMKITIELPSLEIQSQIATLLSDIDTKIETQKQKVEKLKIFKSAMLDKMFPKEGQKVPEIRFNGFSGDWEEKELGSVLTLQGGYAFSSKNMSQTGIKIVQIGNVYSNFLDWNNIVYLNENFASNCENFFLKENDLVIAMTRPIISSLKSVKIAKIQKDDLPCLLNQRVGRFLLSNKIVNSFLKCFMETKYFYENVLEKCSSGVQPNISSKDIESIKCYLSPTLKEQEKIGKYFEELDNKIELETNKLNKLKDVKNAMLNKLLP